jgi:putative spermidine/putrescine transport system permease protein
MLLLVLVPFWTSVLIRGFAWDVLLQDGGPVQRFLVFLHIIPVGTDFAHTTSGLLVGMTQVMLPYMVFPVVAALQSIDPALERASRSMGARGWQTFLRITLPLSLPGVLAGGLLVFLITVGFYVLPVLIGSPADTMLSQIIQVQVNIVLNWGLASAMAVVLVAVTLTVFAVYAKIFGLDRLAGSR